MENRYTEYFLAAAVFILASVFHSINLDFASYELDEAVHLWFAQQPYSKVIEQAANDPNPPVYNLLISTWVKAFGVSEISTRFFSVLMGAFAVMCMYLVASRNFGKVAGVTAALLVCFSPVLFRFTHMARPYTFMLLTVVLSYGSLFEYLRSSGRFNRFWILYWITTTLMIYAHPTSIFNVPAQFCIILLYNSRHLKSALLKSFPLVLAVLSFAIWILVIPYFERSHTMWFDPPGWKEVGYVLKVFYGTTTLIYIQLALFVLLLIFLLIGRKQRPLNLKYLAIICWAVIPFLVSIAFSYLVKPIFQDKYILSVQPGMMLLLSVSITSVVQYNWMRVVAGASVLLVLVNALKLEPSPDGGDWKGVVNHLRPKLDESTAVFIAPSYEYRTFAFYFDRSFYEDYERTINLLGENHVFTSWDNLVDRNTGEPKYERVFVVYAHWGFVPSGVPEEQIDTKVWLVDEKQVPGIKILTYLFVSPDFNTITLRLDDESSSYTYFALEYSGTLRLPVDSLNDYDVPQLEVKVQPDIINENSYSKVFLVTAIQKPDGTLHYYDAKPLTSHDPDGNVKHEILLKDLKANYEILVYLHNPTKKKVGYRNLEMQVKY